MKTAPLVGLLTAFQYTPIMGGAGGFCLTREECEQRKNELGLKTFKSGKYARMGLGCFSKQSTLYWSEGGTYEQKTTTEFPGYRIKERVMCPIITDVPSEAPSTYAPTKQPISAAQISPSMKTLVCGRGDWPENPCVKGLDSTAAVDTVHEVRCCRDCKGINCALPWKSKCTDYDSNLYSRSKYGGECKAGTFEEAIDFCRGMPGENTRLCTPDELKNSCTKGSGCYFDQHLIWSCAYDGHACSTDAECCGTCNASGVCEGEPK